MNDDVLLAKICSYEHVRKLCFMSIHDMHNHIVCLSEDRVAAVLVLSGLSLCEQLRILYC